MSAAREFPGAPIAAGSRWYRAADGRLKLAPLPGAEFRARPLGELLSAAPAPVEPPRRQIATTRGAPSALELVELLDIAAATVELYTGRGAQTQPENWPRDANGDIDHEAVSRQCRVMVGRLILAMGGRS